MIEAVLRKRQIRLIIGVPYGVLGQEILVRCTLDNLSDSLEEETSQVTMDVALEVNDRLRVLEQMGPCEWRIGLQSEGVGEIQARIDMESDSIVLTDRLAVLSKEPPAQLDNAPWEDAPEIRNGLMRWLIVKESFGYPTGFLYVYEEGVWNRRAASSLLGRIVIGSKSNPQSLAMIPTTLTVMPEERGMRLGAETSVDQVGWSNPPPATVQTTLNFRINPADPFLSIDYEAVTDTVINLALLDGPHLVVDGSTLIREEGLFPGLEWLRAGEESSSLLDVHDQEHWRMSPHELKITWPLMALRMNNVVISLLWNNRAAWNGEDCTYTAQFSSPDTWYGTAPHHRMGLALPGGARYRSHENQLLADIYRWPPKTPLHCSAIVTVKTNQASILSSLDDWVTCYGLPSASLPPFDYATEWQLAREAYADTFWDADRHGWGHVLGWPPQYFGTNAFLAKMLTGGRRDHTVEQLEQIIAEGDQHLKPESFLDASHIPGWEPAFLFRGGPEALHLALNRAHDLLNDQLSDGNWGFTPQSEAQKRLGETGTKAVGITAVHAESLLTLGQMFGDMDLIAGGLSALAGMQKFHVPRAAQVWECPAHTPDILASARAVNAYMAGYQATGQSEYLLHAHYWAKTGLPFLYIWETSGRQVMRWASIAIFGSTFYTMSWFGRPVQWNGMVYADAILRLAPYDRSWPWTEVARGILHSAMHQQRQVEPGRGGYPDSWYLPDNTPVQGVDINPETLVKVLLRLQGLPAGVTTMPLGSERRTSVSTIGSIAVEKTTDGSVTLLVSGWQQSHRRLLVAGVRDVIQAEYLVGEQWRPALAVAEGAAQTHWIDWGEGIPSTMMIRLAWR